MFVRISVVYEAIDTGSYFRFGEKHVQSCRGMKPCGMDRE